MSLESEIKPKGKTETLLIHQEFLYYLKKKLEMYRKRNRTEETIISRFQFGHTGINITLYKIEKHEKT